MFLSAIEKTVRTKCHLVPDQPVLVGVSGGADSLALLHALHRLGYPLVVAHLDHSLRPESAEDADYVRQKAEELGLPFVSAQVDVGAVAERDGLSLEEAARNVRYEYLFEQARLAGAQAVAVAHHADDQVETVLMHFLRGAALSGLSGMAYRRVMPVWDARIPLVRPLLDLWREDIEYYLAEIGWVAREDHTNQDTSYFRNQLRHELIPELEGVNPKFKDVVRRMADVLGEEDRFLNKLADQAWMLCFQEADEGSVVLNRPEFLALEKALQRRVFRRAVGLLRPDLRDIGFEAVERGLSFAEEPTESGWMDLAARLNLAVLDERLVVKTWTASLPEDDLPLLPGVDCVELLGEGGALTLAHGWVLTLDIVEMAPGMAEIEAQHLDPNEAWLDADTLCLPLTVRSKRGGERWQPLGLAGHSQKLSDFFVNEKIPQHLRDRWPLICAGDEVAWVAGLRPAEPFKVGPATSRIVRLRLQQSLQLD